MELSSFFRSRSSPDGQVPLPAGVITAADSAARLGVLDDFEQAGIGWIWATDADNRLIYISESAGEKVGRPVLELLGHQLIELFETDPDNPDERSDRPLKFQLSARNKLSDLIMRITLPAGAGTWTQHLVVVLRPSQVRQRRQVQGLSRQRQGRDRRIRAQARGFAARRIRFADRPGQPPPDDPPPRRHPRRLQERQAQLRGDDARSRPLQAGQRFDGPPGGRRTAAPGRRAAARDYRRPRRDRPPRRRRVPGDPAGPRRPRKARRAGRQE